MTAAAAASRRPRPARRVAAALAVGVAATAALALTAPADAAVVRGRALSAPDGDTLVLSTRSGRLRVDLAGIAAPLPGDCGAQAAVRRLRALALGRVLRVDTIGRRRGNRVRGLVFTPGTSGAAGTLNRRLVALGLAEANVPTGLRFGRAIINAEGQAEDAGRGIWGPLCGGGDPGGATPANPSPPAPPPAPAPTPPAATALPNVPQGWVLLGGTAATIPFTGTPDEITQKRTNLDAAYRTIDQRARGGRTMFFQESLGNASIVTSIRVDLCSNGQFQRRFESAGLGTGTIRTSSGTWRITVDFRTLDGVVPVLELKETAASDNTPGTIADTVDADPNVAGRVFLGSRAFATDQGSACP